MTPRRIVGLTGRARSGKDTVGARLVDAHGYRRFAFADALRDVLMAVNPLVVPMGTVGTSVRLAELVADVGWEGAKCYAEVRRLLQETGSAVRAVRPDLWIDVVLDGIADCGTPVVVTDVRYHNEADMVRSLGGEIIRVHRPGVALLDHASETELDRAVVDHVITNGGTVDDLWRAADRIA